MSRDGSNDERLLHDSSPEAGTKTELWAPAEEQLQVKTILSNEAFPAPDDRNVSGNNGSDTAAFFNGLFFGAIEQPGNGLLQLADTIVPDNFGKIGRLNFTNKPAIDDSFAGTVGTVIGSVPLFFGIDRAVSKFTGLRAGSIGSLGTAGAIRGSIFMPTDEDRSLDRFLLDRGKEGLIFSATGMALPAGRNLGGRLLNSTGLDTSSSLLRSTLTGIGTGAFGGVAAGAAGAETRALLNDGRHATGSEFKNRIVEGALFGSTFSGLNGALNKMPRPTVEKASPPIAKDTAPMTGSTAIVKPRGDVQSSPVINDLADSSFNFHF